MRKLLAVAAVAAVAGCFNDPSDPKTWIKQLDDPRDSKEAARQLVKLKNAQAVPALITLFKRSHDPEHLKAIVSFDDKSPELVATLIDSLDFSEDSFDNASIAATALGEIGDKSAVEPLMKALVKPLPVKTRANVVKLEAMKSLSKIRDPRAVDGLIKVLATPAEDQDFFLNKVAAKSLGAFADPKAVPALVRGLFMSGAGATAGANIFQECRASLIAIGEPAVDKLVETLQRKNTDVEFDAKKYNFFPGIVEQKAAMVLGDIRSQKAVPAMLEQLGKPDDGLKAGPGQGVSGHQSIIVALGQIAGPEVAKPLIAILADPKAPPKYKTAAADALNLVGDPSALPALLKVAGESFIDAKSKTIDAEKGAVVASAATAFSRLADDTTPAVKWQALPKDLEETDAHRVFKAADLRIDVAKACKKDVACYAKEVTQKDPPKTFGDYVTWIRAEKAAFMLGRLGKPGLAELAKHLDCEDLSLRNQIVAVIGHFADKGCAECVAALDKAIDHDRDKTGDLKHIVDEMRAVRAQLSH